MNGRHEWIDTDTGFPVVGAKSIHKPEKVWGDLPKLMEPSVSIAPRDQSDRDTGSDIMLVGITIILLCQLVGEAAVRMLAVPAPGPVVGMALLIIVLWLKETIGPVSASPRFYAIENTGKGLLANMSVLYVPASVGIINKLDVLSHYGWTIAVTLVVSTLLAMAATALTFVGISRLTGASGGRS